MSQREIYARYIDLFVAMSVDFSTPYIEQPRPDEPTKQLKIVNIEAKHRGTYYCQAVVGGNRQEIAVTLELFGKTATPYACCVAFFCH